MKLEHRREPFETKSVQFLGRIGVNVWPGSVRKRGLSGLLFGAAKFGQFAGERNFPGEICEVHSGERLLGSARQRLVVIVVVTLD